MDEEEYQRIVNGAAGALAHTENLSAWQKIQDAARSLQESDFMQGTGAWDTSDWGNAYEPGWEYKSNSEMIRDILADNHDIIGKIITTGAGAAAGLPPWLTIPSVLLESRNFIEGLLEDAGLTPQPVDLEGKGEVSGKDIPAYVPYDAGEFTFDTPSPINPAYSRSPTEPGIGAPSQMASGNIAYWMRYPGGGYWSGGDIPDEAIEYYDSIDKLESDWQLEYDAAKEEFDRRNEEEERRHREEYDKMVADILAEQELEASMDTDFSTGDLGQGLELSPTGELVKMLGDYFTQDAGTDGWNEPAESTPPSWLTAQ